MPKKFFPFAAFAGLEIGPKKMEHDEIYRQTLPVLGALHTAPVEVLFGIDGDSVSRPVYGDKCSVHVPNYIARNWPLLVHNHPLSPAAPSNTDLLSARVFGVNMSVVCPHDRSIYTVPFVSYEEAAWPTVPWPDEADFIDELMSIQDNVEEYNRRTLSFYQMVGWDIRHYDY